MKRRVVAMALAVFGSAHAQYGMWDEAIRNIPGQIVGYFSAEELYRHGQGAFVNAYVAGVYDSDRIGTLGGRYCVPDGVKLGQLSDVAWKYLAQTPESRHLSAAFIVRQSFERAWPCSR